MSSNRVRSVNWSANSASIPVITSNNVEKTKRSVFRPPKTVQEKVLCYILCFLFITMMVFLAALCIISERWKATLSKLSYAYVKEDTVCDTDACKESAEKLLSNLDPSTDPCVDFYQYACGGWMEKNPIPEGEGVIMAYDIRSNEVKDIVVDLLDGLNPNETKPKAISSLRKLYQGCMNAEARNSIGIEPMVQLLKDMGGWPMLEGDAWNANDYSWYKQVAEANRKLLLNIFIDIDFAQNIEDNKIYTIFLQRPEYIFEGLYSYVLDDPSSNVSQALVDSIVDSARLLGSKEELEKLREEALKLIIFEYGLYLTGMEEEDGEVYEESLKSLDKNATESLERYKGFTYKEFLNLHLQSDVMVNDDTTIYLHSYYHFLELPRYIDQIDPRHVANYIAYAIMQTFSSYTTEELWTLALNGNRDWMGKKACIAITKTFMSFGVGRLYIDEYFTSFNRYHVNKMVEMIRLAYSSTLDQNTWMDKNTMLYSLVKLQSMESLIGYPEWIADDNLLDQFYSKVLDIDEEDYFGAVVKFCILLGDVKYRSWNKTVDRNDTVTAKTVTVNAFYLPRSNFMGITTASKGIPLKHSFQYVPRSNMNFGMVLPAGILGYPFYKFNRIDSINYGGIGTVIGHEISHAFDAYGRRFDHEGNLKNWWTKEARRKFITKARCFAEQYENFVDDSDPMKVDGNMTLSENIADNGAIRNAFKAFRLHLALSDEDMTHRKVLPGLPASPEQLFFLGYASIWCANMTDDYARQFREYDEHSPNKLRVNIPLANFKEFARAFKCNPGMPMNPRHKCVLW